MSSKQNNSRSWEKRINDVLINEWKINSSDRLENITLGSYRRKSDLYEGITNVKTVGEMFPRQRKCQEQSPHVGTQFGGLETLEEIREHDGYFCALP